MLRGIPTCFFATAAVAAMLALVFGCGDSKNQEITAANSKYAPADRDVSDISSDAAPDVATSTQAQRPSEPREPARARKAASGNEAAPAAPTRKDDPAPRSIPREQAGAPIKLPEGGAQELIEFIAKLNDQMGELLQQARESESIDAVRPQLERNLHTQVAAADKALSLNPKEDLRVDAIYAKGKALHARLQIQSPGAEEDLRAMVEELEGDANPDVNRLTSVYRLEIPLVQLQTGQMEESAPVLAGLEDFLKHVELKDGSILRHADNAVQTLLALDREEDALKAMRIIRTEIEKSGNVALTVDAMTLTGYYTEALGRLKEAEQIYNSLEQKAKQIDDPGAQGQIAEMLANARKRLALPGKQVAIENMIDLKGEPLDWSKYQGKVVLVDFWATWCGPCLREFRNIADVYRRYNEHGFEVIGVNVDDEMEPVQEMLQDVQLPWTVAFSDDPEKRGFDTPLAETAGVETIPFMYLVDQEGKIAALHTRGPRLETEVRRLLNITGEVPGAEVEPGAAEEKAPAETAPDNAPPADPAKPASRSAPKGKATPTPNEPEEAELDLPLQPANRSGAENPSTKDGAAIAHPRPGEYFVSFAGDENDIAAADSSDDKTAAPAPEPPARNPYLADRGLSTFELVQYLQDMDDKPRVIQQRPGFAEAVAEAADRILAASDAKEKYQVAAALTKIKFLHDRASFGDEKSDAALAAFVAKMQDDPREKIAAEVKMLQLERRAVEADKLDAAANEELLADLKNYFEKHQEELGEKHLRMASACVGAINKIDDGDAREKLFGEFGDLFAASSNKDLSRYGKRLSKAPAVSALVGKPLELDGLTELGTQFDWQAYRGKVVLVDFWATWCGPCRKAFPGLKDFYQANHGTGFDVVGVNLDEDAAALADFLDQVRLPWSNLVGEDANRVAERCGVGGLPSMILVDREGNIAAVSHSLEALQPKIEELLKAS